MNTEFENLTNSALHEDVPDKDKINNACGPLQNAIVYIEDEICKTLKIES